MNQPALPWVIAGMLALGPIGALALAGRGRQSALGLDVILRLSALYAATTAAIAGAHAADGWPAAFGALGLIFALQGLGVGAGALYRFLYGSRWVADHPGAVDRDVVRMQRAALLAAVTCLAIGLALALATSDVAHAPT